MLLFKVFVPAYYSTISDCTPTGEEISQRAGYYSAGQIIIQPFKTINNMPLYSSDSNYSIEIIDPEQNSLDITNIILKHENCHLQQLKDGRIKTCNENHGKLYRFSLEAECYVKQYL